LRPRVHILSGASSSGKTWLLNSIAALDEGVIDPEIRAVRAPKFSERPLREKPDEVDDIIHVSSIQLGDFDIAYVLNNKKYGIKLEPIRQLLAKGLNAFVILSDFRVIRELKNIFGRDVQTSYVSSAIDPDRLRRIQQERLGFRPTEEQKTALAYHFAKTSAAARLDWWDRVSDCMSDLESDWRAYATDARSTEIRAEKIRAFHTRYIEHIPLFDHVILNYTENKPEEMTAQANRLIRQLDEFEDFKDKEFPPVFVVAASSGAGKGELLEMLNLIGSDKIRITSKLAKRGPRTKDKRDGMIAVLRESRNTEPNWPDWWTEEMIGHGQRGEFPPEYDLRWEFHKAGANAKGTPYAVSSIEIQQGINDRMPQIFVSNIEQFSIFRNLWPRHAVFVYLHRLVSEHENRRYQMDKWEDNPIEAEVRIAEKDFVHAAYINSIAEFDHVLLNTGFQEDLYDQMFRLLEFYGQRPRA
jgi:hypothetical protein